MKLFSEYPAPGLGLESILSLSDCLTLTVLWHLMVPHLTPGQDPKLSYHSSLPPLFPKGLI